MAHKGNHQRRERGARAISLPVVVPRVGGRMAIHPRVLTDLLPWIVVVRARYDRMARLTLRGLTGRARTLRRGQIVYGEMMRRAIDDVVRSLDDTISTADYERARIALETAATETPPEGDAWRSHSA